MKKNYTATKKTSLLHRFILAKSLFLTVFIIALCSTSASTATADWNYIYEDFEQDFITDESLNYSGWQYENKSYLHIYNDENHSNVVYNGGEGYLEVDFDLASNDNAYSVIKQNNLHSGKMPVVKTEFWMNYTGSDTNTSISIASLRNQSGTGIGFIRLINKNASTYELKIRSNPTGSGFSNSPDSISLTKNTWYKVTFSYNSNSETELNLSVDGLGSIEYDASKDYIRQIQYGKVNDTPINGKLQLDNMSIIIPEVSDLWVDPISGSDLNDGTSSSNPLGTISQAAKLSGPGTTIHLAAGHYYLDDISPVYDPSRPEYKRQVTFNYKGLNEEGRYITIKGEGASPGDTVIDGTGMTFSRHWGGIIEFYSDYVKINNLSVVNSDGFGIMASDVSNIEIDRVKTQYTDMSGLYITRSSNIKLTNNEVLSACQNSEDDSNLPQECITVTHSHDFEISYNKVYEGVDGTNGGEGIDVKGNSYNGNIYGNEVYDLPGDVGIYVGNVSSGTPEHPELGVYNINIFNNKVHNVEAGIAVSSEEGGHTQDVKIFNNLVYDNTSHGIVVTKWNSGTTGTKYNIDIFNNTIYNNALVQEHGLDVQCTNANEIENINIWNNIISQNVKSQLHVDSQGLQDVSICNNLIGGYIPGEGEINPYDTSVCTDCISGNPGFINPADYDFRLLSNSIAINTGLPVYVDIDFDGDVELLQFDYNNSNRPSGGPFDMGAYEFQFKVYEDFERDFITNNDLNYNNWQFENKGYMKIIDPLNNKGADDSENRYLSIAFEKAVKDKKYTSINQLNLNTEGSKAVPIKTEFLMNYTGKGIKATESIVSLKSTSGTTIGFIQLTDTLLSNGYKIQIKSKINKKDYVSKYITLSKNTWYKISFTYDPNSSKELILIVDGIGTVNCDSLKNNINQIQYGRINPSRWIINPNKADTANTFTDSLGQLQFDNISIYKP